MAKPNFIFRIHTDNAAFEDNPDELANILRMLADTMDRTDDLKEGVWTLQDTNGNTVGEAVYGSAYAIIKRPIKIHHET
jgi:hypothetical protein